MNAVVSIVLSLIPDFLRVVASATRKSSLAPVLDTVLGTAASLIEAGDTGAAELAALTEHVKAMVTAGTDPTADDWAALQARSDAAHTLIQGAA